MTLPQEIKDAASKHLGAEVQAVVSVGGGCIAHATRLKTETGTFFLKYGRGEVAHTFSAEAEGLRALRAVETPLLVPEVRAIASETTACPGFLILEWIDQGMPDATSWTCMGRALAALHRNRQAQGYGFDSDNFIGRLPQYNTWETKWPIFFRRHRLEPQVRWARNQCRWKPAWDPLLDVLYARFDELLPSQPDPALLHGDLWSGNVLIASSGIPAVIDPAVYIGHREADLAMTELFGGFPEAVYDAYREAWPLEPGYEERRDVYNLYHLINHLNHFGRSYVGAVERTLQRYR